jgi:hypothetical protein
MKTCIKCGSSDIYKRLRLPGEYLSEIYGDHVKGKAKEECLYHCCRDCSYWWIELPLDSIKKKIMDFVEQQQDIPAEFKKVIDENFWNLI